MAKTDFQTVDEYIATHPEAVQVILQRVRQVIREAVPRAEEGISYQIPAYRLPEGPVLYFAGWKKHYSLYPASASLVDALASELEPYEVRKGTIVFPLSAPVPVKLVARIARFRAKETSERAGKRGATKKRAASKKVAPAKKRVASKKRAPSKNASSGKRVASKKAATKKRAPSKKVAGSKKGAL